MQTFLTFQNVSTVDEIAIRIKQEATKRKMNVKTISMTATSEGYKDYYSAIVVLEDKEEDDNHEV